MPAWTVLLAEDPPKGGQQPQGLDPIMMLMMIIGAFLFFIYLPMRRDAKARRQMMSQLKKNDRVLVNGFMIAQVVQIIPSEVPRGEDQLLIKIDDNANVKMKIVRSAVTRILASEEAKEGS